MDIPIVGLELFVKTVRMIREMEEDKTKVTRPNLRSVGTHLVQMEFMDIPYSYEVKSLEDRYDTLRGALV